MPGVQFVQQLLESMSLSVNNALLLIIAIVGLTLVVVQSLLVARL